jgi:hypothetical protein
MSDQGIRYNRFDQVKLLTSRNVMYLSAPPGTNITTDGVWQVAGVVGDNLLLVKTNITIKIPASDVFKTIEYDIRKITNHFGRLGHYGEGTEGKKSDTEKS